MTSASDLLAVATSAHRQGDAEGAERIYWKILEQNPLEPSALHLLGVLMSERGDYANALPLLSLSLRFHPHPEDSAAWVCNLGLAFERAGDVKQAFECFREAVRLDKRYSEALVRFGRRLCEAESPTAGLEAFQTAAQSDPASLLAWFHYGVTAMVARDFESAYRAFQRATQLDPRSYESWNNLGDLEAAQGKPEEAIACYRRALEADPRYIQARYNLALILQNAGRLAEAESEYGTLLIFDPHHADTLNNLGAIRLSQNRLAEAIGILEKSAAAHPTHVDSRWNLGLAHLAMGNYARGWQGYEARLLQPAFPKREFRIPRWTGEYPTDRAIHIWAEQGLGDTIQFLRYLPILTARGARVTLEVQDRLLSLLPGLARRKGDVPADTDFHCPLMSLPAYFEGIPDIWNPFATPAPPNLPLPGLRVGVCWGANPEHVKAAHRSMPFAALARLGEASGCSFVALQRGPQLAEIEQAGSGWKPLCLESEEGTVADLAAMISTLDLVISVDTMVLHLAATLGKPTWAMLPFAADWRWGVDRPDSPWYPTLKLFRQPSPGEWTPVVDEVQAALGSFVEVSSKSAAASR